MQRVVITVTDLDGQVMGEESLELAQSLMIGRGRTVGMRVTGELISREHLHVEFDIDGLFVSDVSRNGSWLGQLRLQPRVRTEVPSGAKVRLGKDRLLSYARVGEASELTEEELPSVLKPLLDQYAFLAEVERSARRRVYVARHKHLRRTVSVEMPAEKLEEGSEGAERFLREARLYGRLDSPFLIKMYDFRLADRRPIRIVERPEGQTAAERLQQGPLSISEVLSIAGDLAQALEVMSGAGVVHRDIHPETVLLTREGKAKLASFGIAKVDDGSSLTKTGVLLGRLGYTAPEQIDDPRDADLRSDIFALGATLYHLLSGGPPLTAKQVARNQWEPTPLTERREDCPAQLSDWVLRLMAKDAQGRPQTAAGVRVAVEALTKGLAPPTASDEVDPALLETQADDDLGF